MVKKMENSLRQVTRSFGLLKETMENSYNDKAKQILSKGLKIKRLITDIKRNSDPNSAAYKKLQPHL